jgi:U3 small nucleolar RNA-associated protein 13
LQDIGGISAFALRPNDVDVFIAFDNCQLQHWRIEREAGAVATLVRAFKAHDAPVRAFAFDSSSTLLASASSDRSVMVWDVEQRTVTHAFRGHRSVVTCVVFHPDRTRHMLLSGDEGGTINCWDLKTRKLGKSVEAHASAVTSIVIVDDGRTAVSAGRDSVLSVIDLARGTVTRSVAAGERVEALVALPAMSARAPLLLAAAGERGTLRLWNADATAELRAADDGART